MKYCAGVFIADDAIIVSAADANISPSQLTFEDLKAIRRVDVKETLDECLLAGLQTINDILPTNALVLSTLFALPGQVTNHESNSEAGLPLFTASYHRRGYDWSDRDLKEMVLTELGNVTNRRVNFSKQVFKFRNDAEAYALGEVTVKRRFGSSPTNPLSLHLLVDEGLGGCFTKGTRLVNSGKGAELGHLVVEAIVGDPHEPHCSAHLSNRCAEAFVALPALRARYGQDVAHQISDWEEESPRLKLIAGYIAQLSSQLILVASPDEICLSGRAVANRHLPSLIRESIFEVLTDRDTGLPYVFYEALEDPSFVRHTTSVDCGIFGCVVESLRIHPRKVVKL